MADEHRVVVNDEEQYALWPRHKEVPDGWRERRLRRQPPGVPGLRDRTWTDMRPRSVREHLAAG